MTSPGRDADVPPPDDGGDGGPVGSAVEGVAHLQRAAGELIAAARSFLDAAEVLVDDPAVIGEALRSAVRVGRAAGRGDAGPDADYETIPLAPEPASDADPPAAASGPAADPAGATPDDGYVGLDLS